MPACFAWFVHCTLKPRWHHEGLPRADPCSCRCPAARGTRLLRLPDSHRECAQRDVQLAAGPVCAGPCAAGSPAARGGDCAGGAAQGAVGAALDWQLQQLCGEAAGLCLCGGHPLQRQVGKAGSAAVSCVAGGSKSSRVCAPEAGRHAQLRQLCRGAVGLCLHGGLVLSEASKCEGLYSCPGGLHTGFPLQRQVGALAGGVPAATCGTPCPAWHSWLS